MTVTDEYRQVLRCMSLDVLVQTRQAWLHQYNVTGGDDAASLEYAAACGAELVARHDRTANALTTGEREVLGW